jgi:hypothetical protein
VWEGKVELKRCGFLPRLKTCAWNSDRVSDSTSAFGSIGKKPAKSPIKPLLKRRNLAQKDCYHSFIRLHFMNLKKHGIVSG